MCGKFALTATTKDVEKLKSLKSNSYNFVPNPNLSPTQIIPIIKNNSPEELTPAKWGLIPSWSKDSSFANKLFNARAETIDEKPSFRNNFKSKRCLIPATSYYEWKPIDGTKKKQKYKISVKESPIFFFAGLWDIWFDENKNQVLSTTIITTEPNLVLTEIHHRMPVILSNESQDLWMNTNMRNEELKLLLNPIEDEFIIIESE
jgi:putative SOS response-associated peptidase YedK